MTSKGLLSLNWNSDDVEQGVYQIQPSQQTDLPSGITDRAVIMIGRASASSEYYRFALLCDASSNTVKRYWINTFRSTWNGWAELTFDMPSFYKNYSTIQSLAQNVFWNAATSYTLGENETVVVDSAHRISNSDSHIYFIGYDNYERCGMVSVVGTTVSYIVKPTNWDNFFTISCDSGGVKVTRTDAVANFAIRRFL